VVVGARHEGARDRQSVVALAEEDVHVLDRRHVAVSLERAAWAERDRAVADATRVVAGLPEREPLAGPQQVAEVETLTHAEAGERGRGQRADAVLGAAVGRGPVQRAAALLAAPVVVDVERVDLLPLRRLRRDAEHRAVALTGQE